MFSFPFCQGPSLTYVNILCMKAFMVFMPVESMILKLIIFSQANKTFTDLYQ